MTKQMKAAMAAMLMVGTLPMQAQTATKTTHKKHHKVVKKEPVESETARELRELREKQTEQQAEIDALKQANAAANAALAQAQTAASGAEAQAQVATQQAQSVTTTVQATSDQVQALKANVTDLQTTNAGLASTISANKVELTAKIDSPSAIHYKGVTITPVLIVMADGSFRQRSVNSDEATPFNSIPFMGANEAYVTEQNFDARQSRIGSYFDGKAANVDLNAYFEADFLGAGTTSNNNQSNSYVFRQRQFWLRAASNGFAVTGGQMWSLVAEDAKGTDAKTERNPNTIDPNYMVGYTWARQAAFRLQQKVGSPMAGGAVTVAASVEGAQTTGFSSVASPGNFFFAGTGNTGGLFNSYGNGSAQTYTNNVAPDVMTKVALDTKSAHFEVGGLASFFRDTIVPTVAGLGVPAVPGAKQYNDTKLGGGVFFAGRGNSQYVDIGVSGMAGDGVGRYGAAQLADVTVHPNGTLEPVRNYHGLFSLETHPSKKLDVFAYYGGEYAQRTVYATGVAATPFTGYGAINLNDTGCNTEPTTLPTTGGSGGSASTVGTCSAVTRYIQEGVFGFQYKPVIEKLYGQILFRATYEYLERQAWTGVETGSYTSGVYTTGAPKAIDNMAHISLRYILP
jgi:hypothetical protein